MKLSNDLPMDTWHPIDSTYWPTDDIQREAEALLLRSTILGIRQGNYINTLDCWQIQLPDGKLVGLDYKTHYGITHFMLVGKDNFK
jgi:hypothetical protein